MKFVEGLFFSSSKLLFYKLNFPFIIKAKIEFVETALPQIANLAFFFLLQIKFFSTFSKI